MIHAPLPDSAVGHHHHVKPSTGYSFLTRLKGREGVWRCYVPLGHKGKTFRCVRVG